MGTQPKTSGLAIASLVLGILAIVFAVVCVGGLLAIPAIVCGHIANARINRSGGKLAGKGKAITGFMTGYASIVLALLVLSFYIKARADADRSTCIHSLCQIESSKELWASENGKDASATPTAGDLDKYVKGGYGAFKCPKGGNYSINAVGEKPTCSVAGHELLNLDTR